MNKVLLIIQREYLARVKKKSFIIMTFLVPGLVLLAYGIAAFLLVNKEGQDVSKINVIDDTGIFSQKLKSTPLIKFSILNTKPESAKSELKGKTNQFLLLIPKNYTQPDAVQLFGANKPNIDLTSEVEGQLDNISRNMQLIEAGIDTTQLSKIKSNISISTRQITAEGEKDAGVGAAMALSIAGAILVYISLFIYGAQVMRGVLEEKTNRIIEVIVSSVKPFQLMLGKIIGVGMVGLTQFLLWIVLSTAVSYIAGAYFFKDSKPVKTELAAKNPSMQQTMKPQSPAARFIENLNNENMVKEITAFVFFFLTGYLTYSALFAAVGSAVDSETETQQFMMPITMPLLFTYIISVTYLFQAPNSTLAVWLSMIPFTAPVVMMIRMPFDPPTWQIILSGVMMIIGFLFTTWVASRIYRVGILMYGKKTSFKELAKWFFYKE